MPRPDRASPSLGHPGPRCFADRASPSLGHPGPRCFAARASPSLGHPGPRCFAARASPSLGHPAARARVATALLIGCQIAALAGCPARAPEAPAPPPGAAIDPQLAIKVAQAEAARADGLPTLSELARGGSRAERLLALRGLGRVGGDQAIAALRAAFADPDPAIYAAAAAAIGVAASLDDSAPLDAAAIARLPSEPALAALVLEAVGRAGDPGTQAVLATALVGPGPIAEAAAIGLGRHGRRKLALSSEARRALAGAVGHADPRVRYAAVWALSREQLAPRGKPGADPADDAWRLETSALLDRRIADDQPEIRAQAIAALARRRTALATPDAPSSASRARLEGALRDRDWRVAAEAVRALTGDQADDAARDAVAAALPRRLTELERGNASEAHVLIEGLRGLAAAGHRPAVAAALGELLERIPRAPAAPLARGWIDCLATVAQVRATASPDYARVERCGRGELPEHLRLALLGDLITARAGALDARRAAAARLLAHADPRVRAAGIAALPALWKDGDAADRRAAIATVVAALAAGDPVVAGTGVDAAAGLYDAIGPGAHAALDGALVARAGSETDVELAASLLELIGKRTLAIGAPACHAALAGHPVRARAAASCLRALGEPAPLPPPAAATAPPVELAAVAGKVVRWQLTTSRGEVVIRLRPDVAPWAVAAIVALTRKGFYDGIEFHRVVPDFVVQGGDPTQSGWGGPGFSLPAEPASSADGAGYELGGVGIADAGRDSGGSQWFIMHSRAPHLDGRYTWIGSVESGQKSADALLIGDKVLQATIALQ